MIFKAKEVASLLNGTIEGDPDIEVTRIAKIEEGEKGSVSFLANPKYEQYIYTTNSSIVIVDENFVPKSNLSLTLIRVKDAYGAFTSLLDQYNKIKHKKIGIDKLSNVDPSTTLGKNVYVGSFSNIGANVVIGDNVKIYSNIAIGDNVRIGDNTIIYSGVIIYEDCIIGNDCVIHSNVVIGSDGFGFSPNKDGTFSKVPQTGNVILYDNVEIGSSSTIDRATMGSTIISKGVKLDNQVQIAHNVFIGENTVIASQTGIAGSTKIGKNCMLGGQVGIAGHLTIGDFVQIQAKSGINKDIESKSQLYGSPAMEAGDFRRSYIYFKKFPEIVKRLDTLEKELKKRS